jgi:hypothetical protein
MNKSIVEDERDREKQSINNSVKEEDIYIYIVSSSATKTKYTVNVSWSGLDMSTLSSRRPGLFILALACSARSVAEISAGNTQQFIS